MLLPSPTTQLCKEEFQIEALNTLHGYWGYFSIVANAVAGIAALLAWRIERLRGRTVWALTIAAEVAILIQVLLGVILVASNKYEAPRFHMFYGFVIFITVGLLFQYRASMRGRLEMLYGFGGLFVMGLGIRAVLQVVT
ncbi:MAG: hypothetical protein F2894_02250 [Actinobacteria bacterium]|uniref:Unannotated protein n=1 Tax=freshwater metagenome TaxID=449393 RepID=A0A6J6MNR1_9ZZZZ|nr:hypothetical protein [Actinomycetota bacterium]MSW05009.1 hypothetical protein [Actinomycetota bacterium]MSX32967.1 hypothetical protein [Actinomycetota bacterium]MSZ30436.1 hypothetical protein [Actinomycetota bacterium]